MEDICNVFGQVDRYLAKVEWSQHKDKMNITVKEEARKRIIDVLKVREMFFPIVWSQYMDNDTAWPLKP